MAGKVQGVKGTIRTEKSYLLEQRNSACSGDSKKLWNVFNAGLGEDDSDDTDLHTADEFAAFFNDKIESVCASTDSAPLYDIPFRKTLTLEHFTPVTVGEVDKLLVSAPCKTCQLDPVPMWTWLVKEVRALISPFLSLRLNKSLASGCFPCAFRRAASVHCSRSQVLILVY